MSVEATTTCTTINVANGTDSAQISPGLKDGSGNTVAPNLVLVLPK